MKSRKSNVSRRTEVDAFCRVLYEVPVGSEVSLFNFQGALRFYSPGIPAEQSYAIPLRTAIYTGHLQRLRSDVYLRIAPKPPFHAERTVLRDMILSAVDAEDLEQHIGQRSTRK